MPNEYKSEIAFHGMIFSEQALRWQDACTCGNGRVGAMMYGGLKHDVIMLNHENLWDRHEKPLLDPVDDCVPEVRRLLLAGEYEKARILFDERLQKAYHGKHTVDAYQPGPDLCIDMETSPNFYDYQRRLDFSNAVASVTWRQEDTTFIREVMVSRACGFVVLHITASKPSQITTELSLIPHMFRRDFLRTTETPHVDPVIPYEWHCEAQKNEILFNGLYSHGSHINAMARVWHNGGNLSSVNGVMHIEKADDVLALVFLTTDSEEQPVWPEQPKWSELLAAHQKLHSVLFEKTSFSLGSTESETENVQLLKQVRPGAIPNALIERMFDLGKYLLICSTAADGLPANMRGIWNGDYLAPWECDYHNNEELPMTYWPIFSMGLSELAKPYFDMYEHLIPDYEENAKKIYGTRGIMIPHCQGTHGIIYIGRNEDAGHWAAWTAGAGWISSMFYQYWQYTGDDSFLKEHAVPFMVRAAEFYEDFLLRDSDGKYMFVPSLSPENIPDGQNRNMMTINATMDIAICRELLTHLVDACKYLNIHAECIAKWEEILVRLPNYRINEDGALAEWCWKDHPDQYTHRHLSHLYPVFPGHEIKPDNVLFKAADKALNMRYKEGGDSQTGWSLTHIAAAYSRLENSEKVYDCLYRIMRACTGINLLIYHNDWRAQGIASYWGTEIPVPVHPCANMGLTAVITETLIQSYTDSIRFFAAKPYEWKHGQIKHISCVGQIKASAEWNENDYQIELFSPVEQEIWIRLPGLEFKQKLKKDESFVFSHEW